MSAPQISAPAQTLDSSTINTSPTFATVSSPNQSRAEIQSSGIQDSTQDRQDVMDHEPTSPPHISDHTPIPSENATTSDGSGDVQDEMQVDNTEPRSMPTTLPPLPPLPPMSQLLSGFDLETHVRDLAVPIFGILPPIQAPEAATAASNVQVSERDIPTPPPTEPGPPVLANNATPEVVDLPPPPVPDEEEDDFDGQTHFLHHFQEDTSEIPPEQLEEMTRQERSGSRNFQLSGLNNEHWIKQVETSIEDPAFVPKEQGTYTWNLDKFHGTKDDPMKERILRSPSFNVGGFKWNIKLFPHGCEGTDYVSVHIECGGRVSEEGEDSLHDSTPWDVAAQIGCVMFNPAEPRTHHFERASNHFESSNSDWGWVRFYGPWQELHVRRFLEYRPMLQNDKLSIAAYIRVWDDPTKLLWSQNLKNGKWDSFKQTGFKGLVPDCHSSTNYTSALSLLFHSSIFNRLIIEAPWEDPIRKPQQRRTPLIQEFKDILRYWHDAGNKSGAEAITSIQRIVDWYGYQLDGSTDIVEIWQALSTIIGFEQSNSKPARPEDNSKDEMILIRDRQPPAGYASGTPKTDRREHKSVQELLTKSAETPAKSWEPLFGTVISDVSQPQIVAIELKRSKFDAKKHKWCKLTHHVKIDQTITLNSSTYRLRGAVIHRGELGSGDFYSVIRPQDSTNWLKYRNTQVSFLTNKQAIEIHEGKGEGKVGTDSIAYLLVYAREDDTGLFPTREMFKEQNISASLQNPFPAVRQDDSIPVVIHDAKQVTKHQGLGFVDPWSANNSNTITINMRASATLADVQGELLDRFKVSHQADRKEQLRLWPIRTARDAPRFVLELDDCERWPDTSIYEIVQDIGGAHLWLEIIPVDMLDLDNESKPDAMEMSISNLQAVNPATNTEASDVVMANTEDEASESSSEHDGDEDHDDDEDGSSDSNHSEWELADHSYVILKTWSPQLLRLSCQGTHFVPESKQNVMDFVRKTLKTPTSQRIKLYQETGVVLESEINSSTEFNKFDTRVVILVVSPELPHKVQEQRRKAGEPVTAADWYKILQDRRDPAYKQPYVVRDYFGGPYVMYSTTATLPRRKSIIIDTKGDAFRGDLDLNWIKNGHGSMTYTNGNKYEGEWKDDLADGHGVMTYHPSGNRYEGGWLAGRRHGKGIMYYEQSEDQLRTCKICYEEEMNTVLVKCGHVVACHMCAKELKDCPVCRRSIQDIVRMWPTV